MTISEQIEALVERNGRVIIDKCKDAHGRDAYSVQGDTHSMLYPTLGEAVTAATKEAGR